ncbi:MAG: cobalamin-dependent protein [Candidatus Electrothrix sp. GW3-4]|uniref:cobalamin B12-binding domain-containing protein n=1 Tax=Candidatus Electrothrix sp. GW3-4 TaxID=3126740 RepID=UPI0030D19415
MISQKKEVQTFVAKLLRTDRLGAEEIFNAVQEQGSMPQTVDQLILPALETIGQGWEKGTVALAQVYMSSRICEELMIHVPLSTALQHPGYPRMAIAVLDDYHLLGKIIVSACLRASGYAFQDYGRVTSQELACKIKNDSIEIILVSALMLRSALQIKEVKRLLVEAGSPTRIVVGGAPFRFDPLLWKEVGADAMGANAAEALSAISSCIKTM